MVELALVLVLETLVVDDWSQKLDELTRQSSPPIAIVLIECFRCSCFPQGVGHVDGYDG